MIFSGIQNTLHFLTGSIFLAAFVAYPVLLVLRAKDLAGVFRSLPKGLIGLSLAVLLYKLLFLVGEFSSRQDYGVWIIGVLAKSATWKEIFLDQRSPVYFFIIKALSFLGGGVSFEAVVVFNVFLSFLSAFFVYSIALHLFKDRTSAFLACLLVIISPVLFIFSLTEDYTNPALFFSIQALFFACLTAETRDNRHIWPAMTCAVLAAGCRPEYVVFGFLFLFFLFLFVKGLRKFHYVVYSLFFFPKFLAAVNMYLETGLDDPNIHDAVFRFAGLGMYVGEIFFGHARLFVRCLPANIGEVLNPFTLMGVYLFFAFLAGTGAVRERRHLRAAGYLGGFFVILFFFYSFLHREGVAGSFKYMSSLVPPLALLAAHGLRGAGKVLPSFVVVLVLFLLTGYSFYITSPATLARGSRGARSAFTAMGSYFNTPPAIVREHEAYSRPGLIRDLKGEGDRPVFVSNGRRTMLYATAIKEGQIRTFKHRQYLTAFLEGLERERPVYIYQGVIGFEGLSRRILTGFEGIPPEEFREICFAHLSLERKVLDYEEDANPVFLYEMRSRGHRIPGGAT